MNNSSITVPADSLLKGFISDWKVGSILPTAKRTVVDICSSINWNAAKNIVELGAGDGVFSRYLINRASPSASIICVESNRLLADQLRRTLKDIRTKIV